MTSAARDLKYLKHYYCGVFSVANYRFVFSAGGQSSQRGEESRSPGQGEDAHGGRARVHDQEIP